MHRNCPAHSYMPILQFIAMFRSADTLFESEALGIPFNIIGAAEKNLQYQEVIRANNPASLKHLWGTVESMLETEGGRCCLHSGETETLGPCIVPKGASLGVTGSPCNPYSTQRAKRFAEGDVASHCMHNTTMEHVVSFYSRFEPNAGITEQVKGFNMVTGGADTETPMAKCLWLGS